MPTYLVVLRGRALGPSGDRLSSGYRRNVVRLRGGQPHAQEEGSKTQAREDWAQPPKDEGAQCSDRTAVQGFLFSLAKARAATE